MRAGVAIEVTPDRVDRFWAKVNKGEPDECWEWNGERHGFGYGLYSEWADNRRSYRVTAHRMSLAIAGQDISGMVVRHDCDNPPCVNPAHLRVGTQADNARDAMERGRVNLSGLTALYEKVCLACGVTFQGEPQRRYCDEHRYTAAPPRPKITHCPHGHEYTPENTYDHPGGRKCRTCVLAYHARRRAAVKAGHVCPFEKCGKPIVRDGYCGKHSETLGATG